jgi:ribosomal protein S18 acetylase RimI-like enzyme
MIRPAREEDVARCAQLAQTHELANHDDTYVSERFLRSYIDDDELFVVLEEEGEVIGFALAQPFKGAVLELIFLVIAEEHRGKGKGKGLLEHMRTRGEQLKKDLVLWAKIDAPRTLNFYRKAGLEEGKPHISFVSPVKE